MGEYLTSTGGLGTERRPDNRLYHNAEGFCETAAAVDTVFKELVVESEQPNSDITRVVFRGLVSEQAVNRLRDSELANDIEVLLPVSEYGQAGYLLSLARNHAERQPLVPLGDMIHAVRQPLSRRTSWSSQSFDSINITNQLPPQAHSQLLELWGTTFGWDEAGITNFAGRLAAQQVSPPAERQLWFSGLAYEGQIVSAAMAERLDLPGREQPLSLVESTEWRTLRAFQGRGLLPRTLLGLHDQVLRHYAQHDLGQPLIYAECNFTSRSDRSGFIAGMRYLPHDLAPQMAIQNVTVADEILPPSLRDFTVMRVPAQTNRERA